MDRIKAVIFDMDGLMIDSERVTFEGYVIECGKLGLDMDEAFYKQTLGLPLTRIFQMYYEHFGQDSHGEGPGGCTPVYGGPVPKGGRADEGGCGGAADLSQGSWL